MTREQAEAFIFAKMQYYGGGRNSYEEVFAAIRSLTPYLEKNREGICQAIIGFLDGSSLAHALTYNRWSTIKSLWADGGEFAAQLHLHECIPQIKAALARKVHWLASDKEARVVAERTLRRLEPA